MSNLTHVANIVSAYLSNNPISAAELPRLMKTVHDAIENLGKEPVAVAEPLVPAVPIKKSVQPDFIICLEDGKKLKMLKRHLWTSYSMTPEQYRERWGLPKDYPMVAPNYAQLRSEKAKSLGLGRASKKPGAK
ncbi:MucR family transcriptional regulator [Lacibacterium aquatile]|uniref:MucR family transcriptional regulator n=1 Tax=Lacibacterium aquatile TaxID=1168082 RepID=A0ABW5DSJ9_9PROT